MAELGLEPVPSWLAAVSARLKPADRGLLWRRYVNHLGDSEGALRFLESNLASASEAAGLAYEMGFAYNAHRRYDRALELLGPGAERHRRDAMICQELAYAEQHFQMLESAAERYAKCIDLFDETQKSSKAEMAVNLAERYADLGDFESCRVWRDRAREWAMLGLVPASKTHGSWEAARPVRQQTGCGPPRCHLA